MINQNGDILTEENLVVSMNDMLLFINVSPVWKGNPQTENVRQAILTKMLEIGTNMSVVH